MKYILDVEDENCSIERTNEIIFHTENGKEIRFVKASAVEEPLKAYWEKDAYGAVFCSQCGAIRRDNRVGHTEWCNSCGCRMIGEDNEL